MKDLILLALPWQRYDTTAIQLGVLQAYLQREGYTVETRHYYKDLIDYIPPDIYMRIFEAYMGEPSFAALLYPERAGAIEKAVKDVVDFAVAPVETQLFKHPQLNSNLSHAEREQMSAAQRKRGTPAPQSLDFPRLVSSLEKFLDEAYASVDWASYRVIGFTTSHQQFIPTVIMAERLKRDFPTKPIVIGGALMTRDIPQAVLELFDVFDYVVSGEGERTLAELLKCLTQEEDSGGAVALVESIAGLFWRKKDGAESRVVFNGARAQMEDLDDLPIPNYDDYFRHALRGNGQFVFPKLTIEASRACVWGKCVYCNLNLQWNQRYRRKSHARVVEELEHLRKAYKSNVFTFCDTNVVDKIPLFETLATLPADYRILAEVSPHMTREGMKALRDAGVRSIQVGIESFSGRLVQLYERGHTVMRSVEMLKWAAEFDVEIYYNLIINFPLDEPEDVQRSLRVMKAAQHYMYPAVHDFSFTVDSPAYNNMEAFNIAGWRLPDDIAAIYPPPVAERLAQLFSLTIHPVPKVPTGVDWSPVLEFIEQWKARYHGNLGRPGIVYLDGGDFLTISVRGGGQGNDACVTIADEYRDVYLACTGWAKRMKDLVESDLPLTSTQIKRILGELEEAGVLFSDGGKYLALAIPERSVGNYPVAKPERAADNVVLYEREEPSERSRTIRLKVFR
ncbi:MAG TPA: RiPP maturation radical SAM C-methyltransferase [Pyrinomonadaceae bacterium]|nr:RiPP maturation radical SAM C-methyltransferase [Pyrinomonadaceae bacterium]